MDTAKRDRLEARAAVTADSPAEKGATGIGVDAEPERGVGEGEERCPGIHAGRGHAHDVIRVGRELCAHRRVTRGDDRVDDFGRPSRIE